MLVKQRVHSNSSGISAVENKPPSYLLVKSSENVVLLLSCISEWTTEAYVHFPSVLKPVVPFVL